MSLTLYKCADDKRKITKTLTNALSIGSLAFKRPSSIISPSILINNFNGLFEYNYCYISEFDRYYFITNFNVQTGQMVELNCEIDVLYTYSSSIRNITALRLRAELNKPTYITDSKLPLAPYKEIQIIEFDGGDFNLSTATNLSSNFVLNVAGGGASNES